MGRRLSMSSRRESVKRCHPRAHDLQYGCARHCSSGGLALRPDGRSRCFSCCHGEDNFVRADAIFCCLAQDRCGIQIKMRLWGEKQRKAKAEHITSARSKVSGALSPVRRDQVGRRAGSTASTRGDRPKLMEMWLSTKVAVAVVVLLATAAEAVLPAALVLERVPLKGIPVEDIRELDRARHGRMGVVNLSLEGDTILPDNGVYYTTIKLGNPAKKYTFQVDIGSSVSWVTCRGCTGCPTRSQTFLNRCTNSLSQYMRTDGLLGFGQDPPSIISQLNSRGESPKAFSHCLKGSEDGGGVLLLGKIKAPGIVFTPLVPSQSSYNVHLESIAVNGQKLFIDSSLFAKSDSQGTFVDSGTTLAYIVDGAYDPLVRAIEAAGSPSVSSFDAKGNGKRGKCYLCPNSTRVDLLFPTVTLYFKGGAALKVEPSQYLLRQGTNENDIWWCMGWQSSLEIQNTQGFTLLGDMVLRDKIIVYDLGKKRVGWTDYNCSSLNRNTSVDVSGTSPYYISLIAIGVAIVCLGGLLMD